MSGCHNPEGIQSSVSVVSSSTKCVGCGECVEQCSQGALYLTGESVVRKEEKCSSCLHCVEQCPALVHEAAGCKIDVVEVMATVKKDIVFFDQSGGGVTFSGGEPLLQPEFLLAMLKACEHMSIHRAVDTSAHAPVETVRKVVAHTDLFLCDLKHMDKDIHKKVTGVGNGLILSNIRLLGKLKSLLRKRFPLIPGVSSTLENLEATADFVKEIGLSSLDLLPYHPSAKAKYTKLGVYCPGLSIRNVEDNDINLAVDLLGGLGVEAVIGG